MRTLFCTLLLLCSIWNAKLMGCTNIIVTKGASSNQSNMIAYTCDGEFHPRLQKTPAQNHQPGDSITIHSWAGNVVGKIAQVPHTYAVLGYHNMNEHQVAMGETTFGGREELIDTTKFLNYWDLMFITLQRAKTAREAIKVLTDLVAEYGYASSGESFSICDKEEAWLLEMIGPGPGGKGAQWVAVKIPDGTICAHANKARIGEFPLDDPDNCIYSDNVIDFAIEKGYYDPNSGEAFRFNEVYDPATPSSLRYCATRVWSIFRRAAPSQEFSPDYHRGVIGAKRYPLWIKPDSKLATADVMRLIRDHYEGTPYDMTKGMEAGAFNSPNRWRPLVWKVNEEEYAWERCISTYNTGFSIVTQSRNLPDQLGLVWYGVDDTYFTCYAPIYICSNTIHKSYNTGSLQKFSMESVWWVFNLVANYANTKYAYIVKDVQQEQSKIENAFFENQKQIERKALQTLKEDKQKGIAFLTNYSFDAMQNVYNGWKELNTKLITKYNDGYIKDDKGRPQSVGYPLKWRKAVIQDKDYKLPVWDTSKTTQEPQDY